MMRTRIRILIVVIGLIWTVPAQNTAIAESHPPRQSAAQQPLPPDSSRLVARIADEVRHQLVMMPYYGVFDWLEGQVLPDGTVTLRGEVTRETTKSDAEARVKKVESVSKVVNEIEVLPIGPSDDAIRIAMYRAMFNYGSPLFRYATRAVPPIHIIVKNGRVTLKGFVASDMDRQLAYTAALGVSGVFGVTNELKVDKDNY
jgi:osmotically-inducible protein OsmY